MNMTIRRWGPLAIVALLLAAALIVAEWRRVNTPASPKALLYMLADTQRELTRLPVAFSPLSDAEEIRIGDRLARSYEGMTADKSTDPQVIEVRNYVKTVGARLAAHAHRKLPYHFHYIPNPYFLNAFAIPGGHVYIGAGLLALMRNEDELAAVLGHEIEHIDHRHAAERAQMESALRRLPLSELLAIPVEVFEAGYTKDEEFEADREGTRLAVAAGYSPEGAIEMFEAYQKLERQISPAGHSSPQSPVGELSRVSIGILTGYFRSHPANSDRIARIRHLIAEEHWNTNQPERPLAVAYIFLAARAARALARGDYKLADELAAQSLAQRPDYPAALATRARAEIALGNYGPADDIYHQLVGQNPAEADAVRKFVDHLAGAAIEARHYKKAEELAQESLVLQPGRAPAMVMLGEARLALRDFDGAAEATRELQKLEGAPVGQLLSYADILGNRALSLGLFDQAAHYASFRLEFNPGQAEALLNLAEADFAGGDFASAAEAYRKLLDGEISGRQPPKYGYVVDFSEALCAARLGGRGVALFEDFLAHAGRQDELHTLSFQVELAGLQLLAGNATPAASLADRAGSPLGSVRPEFILRLGWWYYRAGNYATAEKILKLAAVTRPGDAALENNLAWVELERGQLTDAIQRFTFAENTARWSLGPPLWNAPIIGRAIARWRLKQTDEALRDFRPAIDQHSPWLSSPWVEAVFTPGVAASAAQLQEEWRIREEQRRKTYPSVRPSGLPRPGSAPPSQTP